MAIKHVDPISRIEGHLGVRLTVDGSNIVTEADVHGNLWRGFENFLIGRNPNDAITFTQRICGVCPVPHGTASTFAVDAVYGYNDCFQTFGTGLPALSSGDGVSVVANPKLGVPVKALHIRNLVLAAEFVMSHLTHSYHLAAPSYVQGPNMPPWTPYFDDSYYNPALLSGGRQLPVDDEGFSADLWSAVIKQYVKALRIRRLTFEAGALFAGRMPMTSALVAGGVMNDKSAPLADKCDKFRAMMMEIGTFVIKEFIPTFLALGALYPGFDNTANGGSGYGAGVGNFLSWGGFPQVDGSLGCKRGYKLAVDGVYHAITKQDVYDNLREHVAYSRYEGATATADHNGDPLPAGVTDPATEVRTVPKRDDEAQYSWLKAPRWDGNPMEVGPFARMVVADYYPVDGGLIREASGEVAPGLTFGDVYSLYVADTTGTGGTIGLDPRMIAPDLAVALVRTGAAKLNINGTIVGTGAGDDVDFSTLTEQQIVDAYTNTGVGALGPAVIVDGDVIGVTSWVYGLKGGLSTMDRLRGRALESLLTVVRMIGLPSKTATSIQWNSTGWVDALKVATGDTYNPVSAPTTPQDGFGAVEAPRGALMHFCAIDKGKIVRYQCVVPTTWNAAPKDANNTRGPMEEAMMGIPYSVAGAEFTPVGGGAPVTTGGGVEALRVAQSFDPCIACAVH